MGYLTTNRIVGIIDNKLILENYQTNPDANFRTEFSEYPDEKITALALLIDVLWENNIDCSIRSKFDDAESVILADEEEIDEIIQQVKVTKVNNIELNDEDWRNLPEYSLEQYKSGVVKDFPMIQFELYFMDKSLLADIPTELAGESVSDTGMMMY